MGKRENKVEKYLNDEVESKLNGITRKWVSPGRDGVPDRLLMIPMTVDQMITMLGNMDPKRRVAYIPMVEVKTLDGKCSPPQLREHVRLSSVGCDVHTVYGEDGVDKLIEELINVTQG